MKAKPFKLKHGYGYIQDYLRQRHQQLLESDIEKEYRDEAKYVGELIHDFEYLRLCAEAVEKIREAKEGYKIIEEYDL